jgi:hypothetical protein
MIYTPKDTRECLERLSLDARKVKSRVKVPFELTQDPTGAMADEILKAALADEVFKTLDKPSRVA